MIKEIIAVGLAAGSVAGGVWFLEGHYLTPKIADSTYIRQDTFRQSQNDQRRWQLQDRINAIQDNAVHERRELTPFEKQQINKLNQQLYELR